MTIKTEILQIELEKLILDNENPRNKPQESQFDAMKQMLLEQDDHIINLAKSISEKGYIENDNL